ncbi:hypothetical protein [Polyangium sorediatum]|uniref:Prolow-density lipoprotein receptor-related protein 1-like beta-propeller domain-containing protein n=1 Tax=Polyangium sorediatum TaxID=889274 RepID=A0ABT6NU63_9BACT|nr:hypothetical protein [Polyangium sorediatum]MDI1431843.1 hypothetical protein [Polyangium sorediatum]
MRIISWMLVSLLIAGCSDAVTNDPSNPNAGPGGCPLVTFNEGVDESGTNGIVADASGVYWTRADSVWRADPGGASPRRIAQGFTEAYTLAMDDEALYVVDYAERLVRMNKDGGATAVLAQDSIGAVAVDEDSVYFVSTAGLFRTPKDISKIESLAPISSVGSIAVDDTHVYVRTLGNVEDPSGHIVRVPKAGGAIEEITPPTTVAYHYFAQELAVDGTNVYWVEPSAGTLMKVPKEGGTPVVLAKDLADPVSLTLDGDSVYVTLRGKDGGSLDERGVLRVPKEGGDVADVARGPQISAFDVAVDAEHVYWTARVVSAGVTASCK